MVKRIDILNFLAQFKFCAIPTVQTVDMGLQFDYISKYGFGTGIGLFDTWPAYKLRAITPEQFYSMLNKARNHDLKYTDLDGTDLQNIFSMFDTDITLIREFIQSTADAKSIMTSGACYCLFNPYSWINGIIAGPEFYRTQPELVMAFETAFVTDYTTWDEADDEELEFWYHRECNEFSEFPIIHFS